MQHNNSPGFEVPEDAGGSWTWAGETGVLVAGGGKLVTLPPGVSSVLQMTDRSSAVEEVEAGKTFVNMNCLAVMNHHDSCCCKAIC